MAITNARMQQKRGEEVNFDPDKMLPGEWAVSLDTKYVRMCFSPGVCVRMATYEAFEADMAKIQKILEECQTIEDAVKQIQSEIDAKEVVIEKYVQDAKSYSETASDEADRATLEADRAKAEADRASSVANIGIMTEETAGIGKPDGTTILADDYGTISVNVENNNIYKESIGNNIYLNDSTDNKILEFTLYGNAEQYREPTPDNPVEIAVSGSDGSVEVVSCGKNLINQKSFRLTNDGTNRTKDIYVNLPANTYTFECKWSGTSSKFGIQIFNKNEKVLETYIESGKQVKFTSYFDIERIYTFVASEDAAGSYADVYDIMISINGGEYEPYTETSFAISTPNGIAGIKVSSGGNYTDENNQQWVCDEIVKYADGSGKRIQRVINAISPDMTLVKHDYSTDEYFVAYIANTGIPASLDTISTHFVANKKASVLGTSSCIYMASSVSPIHISLPASMANDITTLKQWLIDNDVKIYYPLATPITTDLTAEEIAEIEKLHTFYPITNISNDAECGIKVKYVTNKLLTTQTELNISPATKREALNNGNVIDLIGKIEKWLLDLKTVAFSGLYTDLTSIPTPLDSYEEITANTASGKFAGALGVQEGFEQLANRLGAKLTIDGNPNLKVEIRHSLTAEMVTDLASKQFITLEKDISVYGFKSLIYAIPQISSANLKISFMSTNSTATKAVFRVYNGGESSVTSGYYPDVLYIGTV